MRICSVSNCERKHSAKGYCSMHYKRVKAHGHVNSTRMPPSEQTICTVAECNKSFWAKGYCREHYHRLNRYGDPLGSSDNQSDTEKLTKRIKQQAQRYGLSLKTLTEMYELCNYSCMACGTEGRLVVDHDHDCCNHSRRKCGKCVRGLICPACNTFAGYIESNPQRAALVAEYLRVN